MGLPFASFYHYAYGGDDANAYPTSTTLLSHYRGDDYRIELGFRSRDDLDAPMAALRNALGAMGLRVESDIRLDKLVAENGTFTPTKSRVHEATVVHELLSENRGSHAAQ